MAGLPEQACNQAQESLSIALATGSTRTIADIQRFAGNALTRWPTLPEARGLRDMLGSIDSEREA
jgi:hypothetical protein